MNDNLKSIYDSEGFLKTLAAEYVRENGEKLLTECASDAEGFDDKMLDSKLRAALELEKSREGGLITRRTAMRGLIVASLILVVYVASTVFDFSTLMENSVMEDSGGFVNTENSTDNLDIMAEAVDESSTEAPFFSSNMDDAEEVLPFTKDATTTARGGFEFLTHSLPVGWQIINTDYDGNAAIFYLESNTGISVTALVTDPIYESDSYEFIKVFINGKPAFIRIESTHSILFFDLDGFQIILSTDSEHKELVALAGEWI
jgi:hypothetical protein